MCQLPGMLSLSALFCLSGTVCSPMLSVPELPLALVDDCNNKLFCCYTKDTHLVKINCNTLIKIHHAFCTSSTYQSVTDLCWHTKPALCYTLSHIPFKSCFTLTIVIPLPTQWHIIVRVSPLS
jgi:hypothetical protein